MIIKRENAFRVYFQVMGIGDIVILFRSLEGTENKKILKLASLLGNESKLIKLQKKKNSGKREWFTVKENE